VGVLHSHSKSIDRIQVASVSAFNKVIFREYATAGALTKFTSLFPGLGYAAGYKVLQRIYKC
jgi:hypothetical protein